MISPSVKQVNPLSDFTYEKRRFPTYCINMQAMAAISKTQLTEAICDRFILSQTASGLSKSKYAARAGITPQQLSNIARYRNPPSHDAIWRATVEFGFTTDWFYSGSKVGFRNPGLAARLQTVMDRAL